MRQGFFTGFLLVHSLLFLFSSSLAAEVLYPALMHGMEYHDVVRLMGPPLEKIEQESKREDIWIYENRTVSFRDGHVLRFESPVDPFAVAPAKTFTAPKSTLRKEEQLPISEILSDLIERPMPRRDVFDRIRERHQEKREAKR